MISFFKSTSQNNFKQFLDCTRGELFNSIHRSIMLLLLFNGITSNPVKGERGYNPVRRITHAAIICMSHSQLPHGDPVIRSSYKSSKKILSVWTVTWDSWAESVLLSLHKPRNRKIGPYDKTAKQMQHLWEINLRDSHHILIQGVGEKLSRFLFESWLAFANVHLNYR